MKNLKKCIVDFTIKNNEQEIIEKNIQAKKDNNKIIFNSNNDKFVITISDKVIIEKENEDSLIIFDFVLNKETESKYYIKKLDFYIDTKILTNYLFIDNNNVKIEYELWLNEEYSGKFNYEFSIKEV